MKYDSDKHHRRSIRLKGYDYSLAGAYYVTIVAQNRACLLGEVVNGEIQLNDAGQIVQSQWEALSQRFPNVELDEFVVMPNHFHGIIVITDKGQARDAGKRQARDAGKGQARDAGKGQAQGAAPTQLSDDHDPILGDIVGAWKSIVTDEYIRGVHQLNWQPFDRKLWQRNYWEHIVRDEPDLNRIREYIINNPANWQSDENNPKNMKR
ncbi:MAG: transposase [Chloroflexi bacterium]|nr:transposase [Chloroflexota bacterium]